MENKIIKYEHPLIVVTGPSGSGKDTVIKLVSESYKVLFPPTLTTRDMRPGEKSGIYQFISNKEFQELINQDAFIEYDSHFGNFYGTSKQYILDALEKGISIKQIEMNGIKKIFDSETLKYNKSNHTINLDSNTLINIYFVGVTMENIELTKKAIITRDGNSDKTQERINRMIKEYNFVKKNSDYCLVNKWGKPELCAEQLKKVLIDLDQRGAYETKNS